MTTRPCRFLLRQCSPGICGGGRRPKLNGLGRTSYSSCSILKHHQPFPPPANYYMTTTQRQYFSTGGPSDDNSSGSSDNKPQVVLEKRGDFPYGSREYRLILQLPHQQQVAKGDDDGGDDDASAIVAQPVASLRAHRNIIFGAQLFGTTAQKRTLSEVCQPLLDAALEDAYAEGDQPQAMATLHGLCEYVTGCLEDEDGDSDETQQESSSSSTSTRSSKALHQIKTEYQDDLLAYHAVKSMATGIPREGHSVVGQGTFRDGEKAWEALAQEYIQRGLADEVELYRSRGATVVAIEHLADTKPAYLSSAGGAMVRLFFL